MANDKENNPNAFGGPSPSSKLANSTKDLKIRDALEPIEAIDYPARDGLDDVVTGGCSTCGSVQHTTVKCDRQDVPAEFMMSGALQTDAECSTSASATGSSAATPAAKSAEADGGTLPGQSTGRRHSA